MTPRIPASPTRRSDFYTVLNPPPTHQTPPLKCRTLPPLLTQLPLPGQPRGYFNQAQVEDIGIAEDIVPAASALGVRLNPSRGGLLQNAAPCSAKRKTSLPGFKTPAAITAIEQAIDTYKHASADEAEAETLAEQDRITRDALVRKINAPHMPIQHAADGLWPYTEPDHAPVRKLFKLPPDRPFNG